MILTYNVKKTVKGMTFNSEKALNHLYLAT